MIVGRLSGTGSFRSQKRRQGGGREGSLEEGSGVMAGQEVGGQGFLEAGKYFPLRLRKESGPANTETLAPGDQVLVCDLQNS